ncbi:Hypothetical predicted protein [Olea europaea subsp. europaea]|uniref:Uncharacterized protein n=1 Tax=Olea europaea subsp. europaea TaxID=158383 RepID=A0A8S0RG41_OLEEU|nr:Hypothetical predicted protein [Olea europaea subsp. europaea]
MKPRSGLEDEKLNNIEVRYVVPSDDEIVAPYMKGILYKKPLQPHVRKDMQFGDTGDATQSPNRLRLLMITDGCKGHSSDVEDDDDDDNDFVDTPPKRKKTPSRFHPPTKEHATQEYYPTEPEGHDIHTSPQPQTTHADDEPQPTISYLVFLFMKSQFRQLCPNPRSHNNVLNCQITHISTSSRPVCIGHRFTE